MLETLASSPPTPYPCKCASLRRTRCGFLPKINHLRRRDALEGAAHALTQRMRSFVLGAKMAVRSTSFFGFACCYPSFHYVIPVLLIDYAVFWFYLPVIFRVKGSETGTRCLPGLLQCCSNFYRYFTSYINGLSVIGDGFVSGLIVCCAIHCCY